jgi:O-antigen biosynthesis protein
MTRPSLGVVIPTRDRPRDLDRVLNALTHQTEAPDSILVVDNSETEENLRLVGSYPTVAVIRDPTPNLPRLFNRGWMALDDDIIGFLNDDAEPSETWVADLKQAFVTLPDAAAIGGPTRDERPRALAVLQRDGSLLYRLYDTFLVQGRASDYGYLSAWGAFSIGTEPPATPTRITGLTITNMAVRRQVLQDRGGFDEAFSFSDYDGYFFLCLRDAALPVYAIPTASVVHHVNPNGSTRSPYWITRDRAVLMRRRWGRSIEVSFRLCVGTFAAIGFWTFPRGRFQPRSMLLAVQGCMAGLQARL